MIQVFDATTELFLSNLAASQKRSSEALQQISSTYKLSKPSDAPADVIAVTHVESDIQRGNQVLENLTRVQNEVSSAESTIETALDLIDKCDIAGTQGLGLAQDANTRAGIATQVRALQQQLVGLTQLNVQGRYVFSGDNPLVPQYSLDSGNIVLGTGNTVTGVQQAFVTNSTGLTTDVLGGSFTTGLTAERLFDHRNTDPTRSPAPDNVFAAVQGLLNGLDSNDPSTIESAVASLKTASTWLNANLTFYGSVLNRITDSVDMAHKYEIQWTQQLSGLRDTNIAEAAVTLQSTRTQQDAALSAQANFTKHNLFQYLK